MRQTKFPMSQDNRNKREDDRQQALRDLDRLSREGDLLGSGRFGDGIERARRHFRGDDGEDTAERWGQRIGRGLSGLFLLALLWYLAKTYL